MGTSFQLPYSYDTIALILISRPEMFELSFIPFLHNSWKSDHTVDPLDKSVAHFVTDLQQVEHIGIHTVTYIHMHSQAFCVIVSLF